MIRSFFKNMRGPICAAFLTVIVFILTTTSIPFMTWIVVGVCLFIVFMFSSKTSLLFSWSTVLALSLSLMLVGVGTILCLDIEVNNLSELITILPVVLRVMGIFFVMAVFLEYLLDEFYYTDVVVDYIGFTLLSPIVNPRKRHLTNPETLSEWENNSEVMRKVRNVLNS